MADKEGMVRKVYLLPLELSNRIQAYQVDQRIASEVEAARRLLDSALQIRDTVQNILNTLEARFVDEKDLRVLAGEFLTKHALVKNVIVEDSSVDFLLKTGHWGRITSKGMLYYKFPEDKSGDWTPYLKLIDKKTVQRKPVHRRSSESSTKEKLSF